MKENLEATLAVLEKLDEQAPIIGRLVLDCMPDVHQAPEEVRQQLVGQTLPIRYPELLRLGVTVTPGDIEASLATAPETYDAFSWFSKRHVERNVYYGQPYWNFSLFQGSASILAGAVASPDFYQTQPQQPHGSLQDLEQRAHNLAGTRWATTAQ